jgi:hypothetical protein
MAGSLSGTPTYGLTPSSVRVASETNYIKDFNFLNQYLPDTYEKEFERYGNRSIASFLRMVGAEMPTNSDMIKWSEQGRLHTKYTSVTCSSTTTANKVQVFTLSGTKACSFRIGQTVFLSSASASKSLKGLITDVSIGTEGTSAGTFTVAYYTVDQFTITTTTDIVAFVYGSEFKKGSSGMLGSLEAQDNFFDNKPIIIKDNYQVSGSDMAQIGWVEVTTENGATGYLWYIKSEHETRLRFEDYLEMSMVEGVPAAAGSGALAELSPSTSQITGGSSGTTSAGTKGLFYEVENRGNVWNGGNPSTLSDFDAIIQRLDKQGAIQENAIFLNRQFSFDIDDMLAAQNSYGANGTSYGLFDNDKEMALNLGFTGFRRGYDFYKTDWKYLNDATLRGDITAGGINGVMVPAGSTNVYDQVLGKNAKRPFLHVRYRASETEDRRYKTWITGGAGGAATSDADYMKVNFLSERALCVLGANNFFLFKN